MTIKRLRTRIFLPIALPIVGLLAFAIIFLVERISIIQDAEIFTELVIVGSHSSAVVHEIQKERGTTSGFLGSHGSKFQEALHTQRRQTDARIAELEKYIDGLDLTVTENESLEHIGRARNLLQGLEHVRGRVDVLDISLEEAIAYYTLINTHYLSSISQIGLSNSKKSASVQIIALSNFLKSKEQAGIERAVLSNVFSHGSFKGKKTLHKQLLKLINNQDNYINIFLSVASKRQQEFYLQETDNLSVYEAEEMRRIAVDGLDIDAFHIDPVEWFDIQTKKINILGKVESYLVENLVESMENLRSQARKEFYISTLIVLASLLLSILLGLLTSRFVSDVVGILEKDVKKIAQTEKEFRRAEAFKSTMLSSTSEAIVTIDDQGKVVEMNSGMEKIFGYSKEEALGNQIEELIIPPPFREMHIAGLKHFLNTGEGPYLGRRFEVPAIRKDGTELIVEMIVNPMKFDDRFYFTSFLRDITDSIEAKKELSRFKTTLDQTQDCIFIFEPDNWKFIYVNKGAEEQVGYSARELADMTPLDIKPLFDEEQFKEKIRPLINGKCESILFETLHRPKEGADIPVEINLQYITPLGEDPRFVAIVRDISERIKADAAMNRLVSAIEQVAESVVMTDLEGNITYVNNGFETVTGYTREEVIGQNPRIVSSGKQSKKFYQDMWNTILAGKVWRGEFMNKKKDGTLYEEEATISPVFDSNGEKIGYISVKRDVTEERRKEARMQQAQKMESIGVFTGGIAHDFNNILTPILGFADLLRNRLPDDPKTNRDLNAIKTAGMRAKDLISQILLFSRQKSATQSPVRLHSIVKEVTKLLRSAMPATIEIISNVDPNGSIANVDVTQIHSLLMNLATNASHAMPEGGQLNINLRDAVLDDFEISNGSKLTGKYVHLSVADTGTGMDESTLSRIFEPFFTTKEVGSGTGLGLSTVFGIIEQHNGHISVQSEVGKGTTFDIYLPALADQTENILEDQKGVDFRGSESIMFVDDEAAIARSSSIGLEMLGYQVSAFTSSKDALELLWEDPSKFDLVVTDQTMPHMTGTKLADFVHRVRRDLPIIISSGNHIDWNEEKMNDIGIKSILPKPYPIEDLARVIRSVLDGAKS